MTAKCMVNIFVKRDCAHNDVDEGVVNKGVINESVKGYQRHLAPTEVMVSRNSGDRIFYLRYGKYVSDKPVRTEKPGVEWDLPQSLYRKSLYRIPQTSGLKHWIVHLNFRWNCWRGLLLGLVKLILSHGDLISIIIPTPSAGCLPTPDPQTSLPAYAATRWTLDARNALSQKCA